MQTAKTLFSICSFVSVFCLSADGDSKCKAADLSGCWSGSWVSCTTGHQGPLHATLTKIDETHYCASFSGRFWKVLPFRYSATLTVVEDGDEVKLEGSSYLGRIMGSFSYSATATQTQFNATYNSCRDYGKWVLTRCGCVN